MGMHSKQHYDAVGEAQADRESVGTGPWMATAFRSGDRRVVEAVPNHWRKTPEFQEMICTKFRRPKLGSPTSLLGCWIPASSHRSSCRQSRRRPWIGWNTYRCLVALPYT